MVPLNQKEPIYSSLENCSLGKRIYEEDSHAWERRGGIDAKNGLIERESWMCRFNSSGWVRKCRDTLKLSKSKIWMVSVDPRVIIYSSHLSQ